MIVRRAMVTVVIGPMKPFKLHGTCRHRVYRLTCDEFERLLVRADRRCEACGITDARFHIDHDHTTGKVRGLLCSKCNWHLGKVDAGVEPPTEAFQRFLNLPPF